MKRYWHSEHCSDAPDALTLILGHSTASPNEHWEPTLEHLYDILTSQGGGDPGTVLVREAWCIECPNQGESYIMNEEVLSWGYTPFCKYSSVSYPGCFMHSLLCSLLG